jgi:surface protein
VLYACCAHVRCSYQVTQWGSDFRFGNTRGYFWGCSNLIVTATDAPDLTGTTNMGYIFEDNYAFNGDLSSWNTASVTNMLHMMFKCSSFNGDISTWDVAKVTIFQGMLNGTSSFNNDISSWDTGKLPTCNACFVVLLPSTLMFRRGMWPKLLI